MSTKYKQSKDVPSEVLCARLKELGRAVSNGRESITREFYMRVPAEVDNDADLVISEAGRRIKRLEARLEKILELDQGYESSDETLCSALRICRGDDEV